MESWTGRHERGRIISWGGSMGSFVGGVVCGQVGQRPNYQEQLIGLKILVGKGFRRGNMRQVV